MKLRRYITTAVLCVILVLACFSYGLTAVSAEAATVTLTDNETNRTITADTVLDLNGYSITTLTVNSGVTVSLKDLQTDDYNATNGRGYGKITNVSGNVVAADGYLLVEGDVTSAHKVELKVSGVTLRAADLQTHGAGMYYQCTFGGDEVVKENMKAYGVAMGAGREPDFSEATYTRSNDLSKWTTGAVFTGNSTLLRGIMKTGNFDFFNRRNGETDVYCRAYIELLNGDRMTGACVQLSLKDLVTGTQTLQGVEQKMSTLSTEEKNAAKNLYNAFTDIVEPWGVPQIRQAVTGGAYQIHIPADLKILGDKPGGSMILMKDLDMENVDFTPVSTFSGIFDGNEKTISNLRVDTAEGDNIGMFHKVTSTGMIYDLHLENIHVDASATEARFIGTIAGRNDGTIRNCTVTGTITDDQPGSSTRLIFVGALVGRGGNNSVTKGGTGLSVVKKLTNVNGDPVTYTTTGLCAKVKMNVPDSDYVLRRLVGNYSASNVTFTGDWQDLSFSTQDDSALVQARRKTAVKAMVDMGTFKWTVPDLESNASTPDLIHYGTTDAAKKETHIHTQKFFSGTTYYGIPYDHTSSSYEQAMHYMDEGTGGVYVLNNTAAASGNSTWNVKEKDAFNNDVYAGFTKYIGNDCSGAVAWAWHHAAPRWVDGGGVYVLLSSNMMPNDAAETTYGIYRVGPYTVTDDMTAVVDKKDVVTSPAIVKANGMNTMYESYARTQMGDGLLYGEPGGHARLLAEDSVVIRNPYGTIYGLKSYVIVHEQGDGLYDRATTNSSWRINYQYTFNELFNGKARSSGSGYLPITLKAFHDDSMNVLVSAPYEYLPSGETKILTPAQGQINAGNRILCATVTVKDSAGKVVYQKTAYKGDNGLYAAYRSTYLSIVMKYYFSDYVDYVQSGQTYTFSVDCTVAGGTLNADGTISNTTVNVIKDRSFTHS